MPRESVANTRPVGPIDLHVLGARLREQSQIDDPTTGAAEPLEVEARSKLWPHTSLWTLIELMAVTDSGARRLEEYRFVPGPQARGLPTFYDGGLPVAILYERSPNGVSRARVYSSSALAPERVPTLPADTRIDLTQPGDELLARSFAALQASDLATTPPLLEPQGYVQCSDGERYQGRARLRALLERCPEWRAVSIRYCSRFDQRSRTVLELLLPTDRPALCVHERGSGQTLTAVRVYR